MGMLLFDCRVHEGHWVGEDILLERVEVSQEAGNAAFS